MFMSVLNVYTSKNGNHNNFGYFLILEAGIADRLFQHDAVEFSELQVPVLSAPSYLLYVIVLITIKTMHVIMQINFIRKTTRDPMVSKGLVQS